MTTTYDRDARRAQVAARVATLAGYGRRSRAQEAELTGLRGELDAIARADPQAVAAMPRAAALARLDAVADEYEALAQAVRARRGSDADAGLALALAAEFDALEAHLQSLGAAQAGVLDRLRSAWSGGARSGRPSGQGLGLERGIAPYGTDHDNEEKQMTTATGRRARRAGGGSEVRGRALDLIEQTARSTDHLADAQLDAAARAVETDTSADGLARWVLAAADEHYRTAFAKLVANPMLGQMEWTEEERQAFGAAQQYQRAMSLSPDSAGGFLVPFTIDPTIILTNSGTSNTALRAAFTVKTIATDTWVGVSSAGVTAEWTAEAAEVSDASPVLAQPTITPAKGDAFVPFSFELQGDARTLEAELAPLLADAKQRKEAQAFINGTGVTQPRGIMTAAVAVPGNIIATTAADTYAVADVYKLKRALPARYRAAAAWMANEDVLDLTRQFATGTGPQSAFWTDFAGATPPRLLGKPVYETSEMTGTIVAAANNDILLYGDTKSYVVVDRAGSTIELVPHLFGANRRPTGQRGLLLWWRTGGDLVNTDAVRVLRA